MQRKEGKCEKCGMEWQPERYGDPRNCAFKDGESTFSTHNWACGILDVIRDQMLYGDEHTSFHQRQNDDSVGLVHVYFEHGNIEYNDWLVATWYKSRGQTTSLRWANGDEVTHAEAKLIFNYLKKKSEEE